MIGNFSVIDRGEYHVYHCDDCDVNFYSARTRDQHMDRGCLGRCTETLETWGDQTIRCVREFLHEEPTHTSSGYSWRVDLDGEQLDIAIREALIQLKDWLKDASLQRSTQHRTTNH